MTANASHPRTVEIAASTVWSVEPGAGFLTLVADMRGAGLGVTRIEIANGAFDALDRLLNEPAGTSLSVPRSPSTCDSCGFIAPALYVDDPSGQRWCGTCKATVRDQPASSFDPTDPAGGA